MNRSPRDPSIELYRVLIVFGICLLHAVLFSGHNNQNISCNLTFCVDAFAFLSGWFGMRFSWRKVFRLLGTALYSAVVISVVRMLIDERINITALIPLVGQAMRMDAWWFLYAYIVLMSLSVFAEPVLKDCALRHDWRGALQMSMPLLVCIFVWAFMGDLPPLKSYVPRSPGMTGFSGLTLFGMYLVGRLFRLFAFAERVKIWQWALVFFVMCLIIPRRFGFYDSPFVCMMAVSSFFIFKALPEKLVPRKIVCFIAPSCFSIYLLHNNPLGWNLVKAINQHFCHSWHEIYVVYLISAFSLFALGFLMDLPRRFLGLLLRLSMNGLRSHLAKVSA